MKLQVNSTIRIIRQTVPGLALTALIALMSAHLGCGDPSPSATRTSTEPATESEKAASIVQDLVSTKLGEGQHSDGACYFLDQYAFLRLEWVAGTPRCKVVAREIPVEEYLRDSVRTAYHVDVSWPGVLPATKSGTGDMGFPALLPWSAIAFPDLAFRVNFKRGAAKHSVEPLRESDDRFTALKPLNALQLIKLLNLDQSPVLSRNGRECYESLRSSLPFILIQKSGSYIHFQRDLFTSGRDYELKIPDSNLSIGGDNGGATGRLLEDMTGDSTYAINAGYPLIELRGGTHQLWVEEQPLGETDALNKITFRAKAYIAVRGFARGRYLVLRKAYLSHDPPGLQVGRWGDWIAPETRVATFEVMIKDGKTTWEGPGRSPYGVPQPGYPLEKYCASEAQVQKISALVDVSTEEMREVAK